MNPDNRTAAVFVNATGRHILSQWKKKSPDYIIHNKDDYLRGRPFSIGEEIQTKATDNCDRFYMYHVKTDTPEYVYVWVCVHDSTNSAFINAYYVHITM